MKPAKAQPIPPPPVPSRDQAADAARDLGTKKRRGYNSTILGGRNADAGAEQAIKTLLGS